MSSVAVFVFLLDNLAGFNNALNETLFQNARDTHSNATSVIKNCDPFSNEQILSSVSQDLDLVIVPSFINRDSNQVDTEPLNEQGEIIDQVIPDNVAPEQDASLDENNKSKYDFNSFYGKGYYDNGLKNNNEVKNKTIMKFPNIAPFLVAIFETLANVTAQTCAGTLLTPRWVLTSFNCINVLSSLYANNTNMTNISHYTIVSGSLNPLFDGSAHNVTKIVVHSEPESQPGLDEEESDGSSLALLRIEPEVEGPAMNLMAEEVTSGDVMAYGWILSKNESDLGHDTMESMLAFSQIQSPAECREMYSYRDNDVLCLVSMEPDKNVTQLSTGGPVLYVHDGKVKMLAVLQTDDYVFVSYPIAPHYDWINHTISTNI